MSEKQDFHIKVDKALKDKAKELSGLTNRELFELGCRAVIMENMNPLDSKILDLHNKLDEVNELSNSIISRLKNMQVPTKPPVYSDDENDLKRNQIPLEMFKEICMHYMKEFNLTELDDIQNKNKEIYQFVLINLAYHEISAEELNKLYKEKNSQ